MVHIDTELQIPIVVTKEKSGRCRIYVPDLKITIHGEDYIEAQAEAILKASAIYYYNAERNVHIPLEETYQSSQRFVERKDSFVTFMGLTT